MFGWLPCFKMYDRVSHARISHMRLGLVFFCFNICMCFGIIDAILIVKCMLVCVCVSLRYKF